MYILFNGNRASLMTNNIQYTPYKDWLIIKNNNERLNDNNKKDLAIAYFDNYTNPFFQEFKICNKGELIYSDYIYYWEYKKKFNISHIDYLHPYSYIEISIELYHIDLWDIVDIPEYYIVFTIY